jgi:hypothetical protein
LHGEGVAYPESLSYNISVNVNFPGSGHVLDEVTMVLGNETDGVSIAFADDGFKGVITDGLGGSVVIIDNGVVYGNGTKEYVLSLVVMFNWDYPILGDSWISVHVRHGGLFASSFDHLVRYRVEKGIELVGVPRLTDRHGEDLPGGNWTSSKGTATLTGLRVVHLGTEDLLVHGVFGLNLSYPGGTLVVQPRGTADPRVELTFDAPVVIEGVGVFPLTLRLDDLVTGASAGPPVMFELRVDDQPPDALGQVSMYPVTSRRDHSVICLDVTDGNGCGVDVGKARWRVSLDGITGEWREVTLVEEIPVGLRLHALVPMVEDGEYLVHWRVPDLVGNEKGPFGLNVLRDTVLPEIALVDGREWYNTTVIDLVYTVDDQHAWSEGPSVTVLTEAGEPAEHRVISSDATSVSRWDLTIDLGTPGGYWILVDGWDLAGNGGHLSSRIGIDTEAPTIAPDVPSILNATGGTVHFEVHIDDGNGSGFKGAALEYAVGPPGGPWAGYQVLGDVTADDITVGMELGKDTSIRFRIMDRAGNVALSRVKWLDLNEPPVPRISQPLNGSESEEGRGTVLNGSESLEPDHQELTYRWMLDGDDLGQEGPVVEIDLEPGSYSLVLVVSDGHHTVVSDPVHFTILDHRPTTSSGSTTIWVAMLLTMLASVCVVLVYVRTKRQ